MARYTACLDLPETTFHQIDNTLQASISSVLEACNLSIIYSSLDYLVAKEKPGHIALAELATIEVLIHPPSSLRSQIQLDLIVKNDQLPLTLNNHCQRLFDAIHQALVTQIAVA
ncbi:MAG: hypothetical protein KGQ93_11795 [Cyanobacteria bacterium REEB459]|nr:hypothetical protein [Cyanobacteria bacterium REEB459]